MTSRAARLLLLACGFFAVPSLAAPEPAIRVQGPTMTVTGVTPGAPALLFGAGLEPKKYHAVLHRWSTVAVDADHDGAVTYDLRAAVTWNAFWVVADLRSGQYGIASTAAFPVIRSTVRRRQIRRDDAGEPSRFLFGASDADVLYVAPGGAWYLEVHDGDISDADGASDGAVLIDLSRLRAADGAGTRPRAFTPGGTLLIIDPSRLELLELRLDAAMLKEAR